MERNSPDPDRIEAQKPSFTPDTILADLKKTFGRKVRLSPSDIAPILAQSAGAQAIARSRGTFGIPTIKDGARIYVSIYALADYLYAAKEAETNGRIPEHRCSCSADMKTSKTRNKKDRASAAQKTPARPSLGPELMVPSVTDRHFARPSLNSALTLVSGSLRFEYELYEELLGLRKKPRTKGDVGN